MAEKEMAKEKKAYRETKNDVETMDEVAGRGSSARSSPSDHQDKNKECAQCAESGKRVSAAGFCRTCTDFLCISCIDQHKVLRGLKGHELLEGEYTLNSKRAASDETNCAVHPSKPIQAYCKDEDTFGCLECFVVGHRACKNVGLLSDLSQGVELSKEFLDVQKAAERCKTLEEQYRQAIQKCLSMNEDWHNITLEDFQKFRSNILSMVDEIGEKISKKADKLKEENQKQLRELAKQVTTHSEQAKQYLLDIEEKNNEQSFLVLKKTGRDVIDTVHHMEKLYQDIHIKAFNFSSDPSITANLNKNVKISVDLTPFLSELGTKSDEKEGNTNSQTPSSPETTCISTSKVDIRSPEDSSDCLITAMAELSATQLILSDWNNNCLKLLDLTSSTIIKKRNLASHPWDIIMISDRVAVSLPLTKQIQIFTADTSLDPCEALTVSGECHYTGDQLAVFFVSPVSHVEIGDPTGNAIQSMQNDTARKTLFKSIIYKTINMDNEVIYTTDNVKHTVTCMAAGEGEGQWVYQDQELHFSNGVTIGNGGCIFVSSNEMIHVISSDGSKLAVIPQSQAGIKNPIAVCYSSNNRTLYVSSDSDESDHGNFISKLKLQ